MAGRGTIDQTLTERHRILHLLDRLREETISLDEIDDIGTRLQKSGRRALKPLVRRLWREKKGDLLSRYAYLLDFFTTDVWLDQLIQIALRRRDLEEEGKAVLATTLEGCGVDIHAPPFAHLLCSREMPQTLPRLLDRGDEGLAIFVEDLLFHSTEERIEVIRALPKVEDPRVPQLLGILLGIEDRVIMAEAIAALGRVRKPESAGVLEGVLHRAEEELRILAGKSLRRLAFLGITAPPPTTRRMPGSIVAAAVSPLDGAGYRVLWFNLSAGAGPGICLYLQVHDLQGLHTAWGTKAESDDECAGHLAAVKTEEGAVEVAPEYALRLLKDAICRNREKGTLLPAEYYVWSRYFDPEKLSPTPYRPCPERYRVKNLAASSAWVRDSAALFDDDYLAGWVMVNSRVYDLAEEWLDLEKQEGQRRHSRDLDRLVKVFCRELIEPQVSRLKERLLLTADLMVQTGRDREITEKTVAVAASLDRTTGTCHCHPFLRRFALESMDMAREALREGYDFRDHCPEDDDESW